MASITLKGREIPLLYTTLEMKTIAQQIAPVHKALKLLLGKNPDDENDDSFFAGEAHLDAVGKMVAILGNAALEEAGQEPDLTDKKVLRMMKPHELGLVVNSCMDALNEGMMSEIPEKEEEGPVDVTLEEMNKKKERED